MSLKDKLLKNRSIREYHLARKYGPNNIHTVDLGESIKEGVEDRLLGARKINVGYVVDIEGIVPYGKGWDPYGDGTWNPVREFITTDDIKTKDKDLGVERQRIYDFLRGKPAVKSELQEMMQEEEKEEEKSNEKVM